MPAHGAGVERTTEVLAARSGHRNRDSPLNTSGILGARLGARRSNSGQPFTERIPSEAAETRRRGDAFIPRFTCVETDESLRRPSDADLSAGVLAEVRLG